MILESLLVLIGVIASLKALYEWRLPFVREHLSVISALILIYVPYVHLRLRKQSLSFLEKSIPAFFRSFGFYLTASAIIFPLFLLGSHFYQTLIFGHKLHFSWPVLRHVFLANFVTQLILVALPEEFFFRGYLQTVLYKRFHGTVSFLGIKASWAVPITAFLFALSHSIIALRWWHFAIFFPALVFGWLREKSGGLVAPILFHATCNILIQWVGRVYF